MPSFATRKISFAPPARCSRGPAHSFAPLQRGPAVVEQAQLGQFLRQLFVRRVSQRMGHIVQKQSGKLLPGSVQDLSNSGGCEGPSKLGAEVLCQLRCS